MTKFLTNEDISNIFVFMSIMAIESSESEVIKNTPN